MSSFAQPPGPICSTPGLALLPQGSIVYESQLGMNGTLELLVSQLGGSSQGQQEVGSGILFILITKDKGKHEGLV